MRIESYKIFDNGIWLPKEQVEKLITLYEPDMSEGISLTGVLLIEMLDKILGKDG